MAKRNHRPGKKGLRAKWARLDSHDKLRFAGVGTALGAIGIHGTRLLSWKRKEKLWKADKKNNYILGHWGSKNIKAAWKDAQKTGDAPKRMKLKRLGKFHSGKIPRAHQAAVAKIARTAKRLYPQLGKVMVTHGHPDARLGGGGWMQPSRGYGWHDWLNPLNVIHTKRTTGRFPGLGRTRTRAEVTSMWAAPASVMAHELGHGALHEGGGLFSRRLKSHVFGASRSITTNPFLPLLEEPIQRRLARLNVKPKTRDKIRSGVGWVIPTLTLPTLYDEAQASVRGLRILKAAGHGKMQMLKNAATLGTAFGSYLGIAAAQTGASRYLAKHKFKERRR